MTRWGSLTGVSSARTMGCGPLQADPGSRPWLGQVVAACSLELIPLLPGIHSASDLYLHKICYFFKKTKQEC